MTKPKRTALRTQVEAPPKAWDKYLRWREAPMFVPSMLSIISKRLGQVPASDPFTHPRQREEILATVPFTHPRERMEIFASVHFAHPRERAEILASAAFRPS